MKLKFNSIEELLWKVDALKKHQSDFIKKQENFLNEQGMSYKRFCMNFLVDRDEIKPIEGQLKSMYKQHQKEQKKIIRSFNLSNNKLIKWAVDKILITVKIINSII